MSASLGATTYTSVTWTTGDTITEAKLDNMVANDQAYDSHASQGMALDNNKSFAGRNVADTDYLNLAKLDGSDDLVLGDTGIGLSATNLIADEDDMSSNSADKLATQQSIKKYVDDEIVSEVTGATNWIDGTHLSTNFGDADQELLNFIPNFAGNSVLNRNGGASIGTWTDVNLSAVVPSTCKAVLLYGSIKQNNGNVRSLAVRPYNVSTSYPAMVTTASQGETYKGTMITGVVSQKIQYIQSASGGGTNDDCDYVLSVIGWWESAQT